MSNIYTVGFLFSSNLEEVLLIEKQRPAWQKDRFNGIGGAMKVGESPVGCMVREFQEETGLLIPKDNWTLFHRQRQIESGNTLLFYYAIDSLETLLQARTTTDEEVRVFDIRTVMRAFMPMSGSSEDYYVYNLGYLLLMAIAYARYPEHRYLEG